MTRKCNMDSHWCGTWGICALGRRYECIVAPKTCLADYFYALFTMSATIDFSNDGRKAKRHWRDWSSAVLLLHHQDGAFSQSSPYQHVRGILQPKEITRGRLPLFSALPILPRWGLYATLQSPLCLHIDKVTDAGIVYNG